MKTLLTLAFALVFVMSANAQNTATVNQSGTGGHDADIEQTGQNTATVDQAGSAHLAAIVQSGTNEATTDQSGSGNTAEADQTGTSNEATITQTMQGNYGGVWQGIESSTATGATATISQNGTDGIVYAMQGRGGAQASVTGSIANISQEGADNFVYTMQGTSGTDNGSSAIVQQATGTSNSEVYTFQGHGGTNASINNMAVVNQNSGSGNWAQVSQAAEVWNGNNIVAEDNTATIEQDGDNNDAAIYQGVAVEWEVLFNGGSALNNEALIDQNGNNNKARLYQGIDGMSASSSFASIVQNSDGNIATTTQNGAGNTATTTQN